eukprot:PhF_6_TR15499/c0_g1_i1/m.24122
MNEEGARQDIISEEQDEWFQILDYAEVVGFLRVQKPGATTSASLLGPNGLSIKEEVAITRQLLSTMMDSRRSYLGKPPPNKTFQDDLQTVLEKLSTQPPTPEQQHNVKLRHLHRELKIEMDKSRAFLSQNQELAYVPKKTYKPTKYFQLEVDRTISILQDAGMLEEQNSQHKIRSPTCNDLQPNDTAFHHLHHDTTGSVANGGGHASVVDGDDRQLSEHNDNASHHGGGGKSGQDKHLHPMAPYVGPRVLANYRAAHILDEKTPSEKSTDDTTAQLKESAKYNTSCAVIAHQQIRGHDSVIPYHDVAHLWQPVENKKDLSRMTVSWKRHLGIPTVEPIKVNKTTAELQNMKLEMGCQEAWLRKETRKLRTSTFTYYPPEKPVKLYDTPQPPEPDVAQTLLYNLDESKQHDIGEHMRAMRRQALNPLKRDEKRSFLDRLGGRGQRFK